MPEPLVTLVSALMEPMGVAVEEVVQNTGLVERHYLYSTTQQERMVLGTELAEEERRHQTIPVRLAEMVAVG